MKHYFIIAALAAFATSCTSVQLENSTLGQGKTFTDLEYSMVLDNVAMFVQSPDSLPWQLQLTQGSITLNDSLSPSFSYTWPTISRDLGITASREWQEGWTVVPVTDNKQLLSLQGIYQGVVKSKTRWFEEGSPEPGCPSGRYGTKVVWVKPENISQLTGLVLQVLETTKNTGAASLFLPGPVPRIN